MVRITNGISTRYVTVGAYNTIYKSKGYRIVGKALNNSEVTNKQVEEKHDGVIGVAESTMSVEDDVDGEQEEDWVTELLEKPISQWSKEETANFVKEKGIDTSSAHKLGEVKDIIKRWIDDQRR